MKEMEWKYEFKEKMKNAKFKKSLFMDFKKMIIVTLSHYSI